MKRKSLTRKIIICLIAGLLGGAVFLRIGNRFLSGFIPIEVILALAVLVLVAAVASAFVWHRREKRSKEQSTATDQFWIGWLRYGVAFDLTMFGFQKIFHLQFITPLGMLDEPHSSFSGEWLTWSYFGYSYPFAVIIGLTQIVGSLLMLFSRTRLLGLVIILPVLINIVLIDLFYGMAPGVLAHAMIILTAAVYLLLCNYSKLFDFFLKNNDYRKEVVSNDGMKWLIRLSVLVIPLILIFINESPNKNPDLNGRYNVTEMSVNGTHVSISSCADSLLSRVYLDLENECVFEFNDQKRRLFGRYELSDNEQFSVRWHYPAHITEVFNGLIVRENGGLRIDGEMGNSKISARLVRD